MTSTIAVATDARWYAIAVHARKERAAADDLRRRGIECFVPTVRERRAWSDRIQTIEHAVFPGYAFVHLALDASSRVDVLGARHVRELVGRLPGDARIARQIPDEEIASLAHVLAVARSLDPVMAMVRGTRVRVARGPLRGVTGIVDVPVDGQRRITVLVTLLGRGVRTTLSADDVLDCDPPSAFTAH